MFGKKTKSNTEITETLKKGKVLSGIVVSDKMQDTVVVSVSRYFKHPKYQKFMTVDKRYKVHDKGNTKKIGEKVDIIESKPISKTKRFVIFNA
jgi:small subunit ribosomal protein S17